MKRVSQNVCITILLWSLWSRYFTIVSVVHLELFFFFCGPSLGSDFAPEFWEVSSVHHSNVASALLQV